MTKHADITVYDTNNNLQLVVEVKNQPDVSAHWATQMRRNLLKHEFTPNAPYFLLVLPENFYLWKKLFRLPDLGAIKCYVGKSTAKRNFCRREWFQIELWPPIAPN